MANLTATDEDELLEIDEAKASDATPSKDELMMNILTQMSGNLNTLSEIWGKLSRQAKGNDLQFSRLQTHLTKVGHIVAKSTDLLLKAKADSSKSYIDDLVRMNTHAIALLTVLKFHNVGAEKVSGHTSTEIMPHFARPLCR